jgi:eukaryotic-like serine/threonine-protein kinase
MYRKHFAHRHLLCILSGCCLVFLLAGCFSSPSSPSTGNTPTTSSSTVATTGGVTPTSTTSKGTTPTPTLTTVQMPATQTSCPASGTARAAVTAPLAVGSHPNIVYIYNQNNGSSPTSAILRRFDATTGLKKDIVNIPNGISEAQLSADRQWALFVSQVSNTFELQMVRMDGQGLQTLTCSSTGLSHVQWTPDQKTVAFMNGQTISSATVYLLTLATGTLQAELLPPPNGTIGGVPRTWLDNTHLYLIGFVPNSGAPPQNIYILDTTKGANQHDSDLQKVVAVSGSCFDFDTSFDNTKLFLSQCQAASPGMFTGPSSITAQPAMGGTQSSVFSNSTQAITGIRVISTSKLLFTVEVTNGDSHNGLWKVNTDGTGLTRLTTDSIGHISSFNSFTQFTWANVSRDGSFYALKTQSNQQDGFQNLVFGNISGGAPTTFASLSAPSTDSISIVGWTTM